MDFMHPHFADGMAPTWADGPDRLRADIMACVLHFNQVTVEGIHPSWLAADEVFWRDHVRAFKQPESRHRVSQWLRDRFKLNDCYDGDFEGQEKRVYLIPIQPFERLALCVGASLCVSMLRKQLARTQVVGLRETLGEATVRQLFSSFHENHNTGVDVLVSSEDLRVDKLYPLGAQALLCGAQRHGEAVLRRTQLKLRRECTDVDELLLHARDTSVLQEHLMMVAVLFLPEWNALFTPDSQEMAA